jgi:hypothetical protein
MIDRRSLARQALRSALETRRKASEAKSDPICVYDLAERLGVEVKFCLGNSFGGGYAKASETVLVPALRPAGRQAFTCGHELGHWHFGHGNRLDELSESEIGGSDDPDEQLANLYAGYLLMPVWAVESVSMLRGLTISQLAPVQMYAIACQLGVGYETLIHHLRGSLQLLSYQHAQDLLKTTPKSLRYDVLGDDRLRHMVIVDACWRKLAIDLQVGDVAVIAHTVQLSGPNAVIVDHCQFGTVVEARTPGVMMAQGGNWAASIRVRRKDFHGRSIYRHMEDPDVNEMS